VLFGGGVSYALADMGNFSPAAFFFTLRNHLLEQNAAGFLPLQISKIYPKVFACDYFFTKTHNFPGNLDQDLTEGGG